LQFPQLLLTSDSFGHIQYIEHLAAIYPMHDIQKTLFKLLIKVSLLLSLIIFK